MHLTARQASRKFRPAERGTMKPADVSSLRMLRRAPTAYRREAARRGGPPPIPGCFALMWRSGLPASRPGNVSLPEKPPPPAGS